VGALTFFWTACPGSDVIFSTSDIRANLLLSDAHDCLPPLLGEFIFGLFAIILFCGLSFRLAVRITGSAYCFLL